MSVMAFRGGQRITIRPVMKSDANLIYMYFNDLSQQSKSFFHPHPFDMEHACRIAADTNLGRNVRRVAVTSTNGEERIVGYAFIEDVEGKVFPSLGIGVIDEYQNFGIGKALMKDLIDQAKHLKRKGLELSVYKDNYRALHVYSSFSFRITGETKDGKQHTMKLDFSEGESPFKIRGMYLHCIPWGLTKLTADTWTFSDWQWYLRFLNSAGCNLLKIYIWPNQFFHPDYPETYKNEWRFKVYKEALGYARILGIKTYVAFSNNTAPSFIWLSNPELRAEEIGYRGITLCWTRGKERIIPFQKYIVDYFADVADGFVIWFADPGFCACEKCRDYTSVVLDSIETLKSLIAGRAALHVCLWWFEWIEKGGQGIPPNPNIREKVLDTISRDQFVIIDEHEPETLQMAKKRGLDVLKFAFFLDPEGGTEVNNILPQPKLQEIDEAVKSSKESSHAGIIAYRLTPYTQLVSDWVFFRKQLHPNWTMEECIKELAQGIYTEVEQASEFTKAILLLDKWWREKNLADLQEASRLLDRNRVSVPTHTGHLADSAQVLLMLSEYVAEHEKEPIDEFVSRVQEKMSHMPIFQGFTLDNLWEKSRARAFTQQRIEWWIQRLTE